MYGQPLISLFVSVQLSLFFSFSRDDSAGVSSSSTHALSVSRSNYASNVVSSFVTCFFVVAVVHVGHNSQIHKKRTACVKKGKDEEHRGKRKKSGTHLPFIPHTPASLFITYSLGLFISFGRRRRTRPGGMNRARVGFFFFFLKVMMDRNWKA